MGVLQKITTGVLVTTFMVGAATPALADRGGYGGGWGGGYHREHRDNTGAIVAGVIGVGILAAIIASASNDDKKRREAQQRTYGYNNPGYYPNGAPYPSNGYPNSSQGYRGISSENEAVDACVSATQRQAGASSRISSVDKVRSTNQGYDVRGVVETRNSFNDYTTDAHNFKCTVRYGQIESVRVDDELAYGN